ncbi:MAG TPA: TlyA family RNA methyltransferase [Terriglobales bacterium]|nr:TlyA family RNA methyltransferase [Terriglobales bacterium]
MPTVKVRIDKLLVERGLVISRERAQALVLAGRVLVNDQKVEKPGTQIDSEAELRLLGEDLRYVSRGGLKLEAALENWELDLAGRIAMDVGASTGGFTDCMLQHGAAQVIAIDTGYGQIAARLRSDLRVKLLEKTNARYLTAEQVRQAGQAGPVSFIAIDVSFISVTLILPAILQAAFLARHETKTASHGEPGAAAPPRHELVVLIKPQFEVGRERVGKGGIVRDEQARQEAVEKVRRAVEELGGRSIAIMDSPIRGAEGNREFLLYAEF